jgi:hypothetical protein
VEKLGPDHYRVTFEVSSRENADRVFGFADRIERQWQREHVTPPHLETEGMFRGKV